MVPTPPPPALALTFAETVRNSLPGGAVGALVYFLGWVVLAAGIVVAFDKVLHARARRSRNPYDDAVANALRFPLYVLLVLAGLWGLNTSFDLAPPEWRARIQTVLVVGLGLTVAHTLVRILLEVGDVHAQRRPAFRGIQGVLEFVARVAVYSLALMLVLDHLGITITPLLGALGIAGLAVALALQDTLSNFFAGMYMTIDRPLREGDFIELDGGALGLLRGHVLDIGWRSVRIRELSNNVFVVPNSVVASGIIKNYDLPVPELSVVLNCSVAYGSDLEHVERVVIEEATRLQGSVQGAARTHQPFVRFNAFGADGIGFSTILRANTFVDQYLLQHEFTKALHRRFQQEGIDIPFPQRTLHFAGEDGNGRGRAAVAGREPSPSARRS